MNGLLTIDTAESVVESVPTARAKRPPKKGLLKRLRIDKRGASEFSQSMILMVVIALGAIAGAIILRKAFVDRFTGLGGNVGAIGGTPTLN